MRHNLTQTFKTLFMLLLKRSNHFCVICEGLCGGEGPCVDCRRRGIQGHLFLLKFSLNTLRVAVIEVEIKFPFLSFNIVPR